MLPGRIARARNHPQAAAIAVGGWMGTLALGIFWPLALIWAFTSPREGDQIARLEARVEALERARASGGAPS